MIFLAINGGCIFYPKFQEDLLYLRNTPKLDIKMVENGVFIPNKLVEYFSSYKDGKYNFYFSELSENGLFYDFRTNIISNKRSFVDGFYNINVKTGEIRQTISGDIIELKPRPIHVEIIDVVENLQKQNQDLLKLLDKLNNQVDSIINTLRTTPAVNGAPLNPAQQNIFLNELQEYNQIINDLDVEYKNTTDIIKER
jgi:hypothetical protein